MKKSLFLNPPNVYIPAFKNKQNYIKLFFRFLFVNYNAWHYIGCEYLWAGIAKALVEKVEEEFGVFTTRIYRSLPLESPYRGYNLSLYRNQRHFFFEKQRIDFESCDQWGKCDLEKKLEDIGGPVDFLKSYPEWRKKMPKANAKRNDSIFMKSERFENWWVVQYKKTANAQKAFKRLSGSSFVWVSFNDPSEDFSVLHFRSSKNDGVFYSGYRYANISSAIVFASLLIFSIMFPIFAFQSNTFEELVSSS